MWNRTATARLFLDDKELTFGTGPSTQMTSTQMAPGLRGPYVPVCSWRAAGSTPCVWNTGSRVPEAQFNSDGFRRPALPLPRPRRL